ncbi:MAG: hypothetical protein SV062_06740 [Thermodesulfobacteriota bacterium]|nr:hypothetical protein [Thermodesulfobacteriota bacterium]
MTKALNSEASFIQIVIEAKITEIDSDSLKDLGIRWGGRFESGDLTARGTSLNEEMGSSGENFLVDLPADVARGSGGAIGFFIGDLQKNFLDLQLSALEEKGRGKVLASPKVITQDNQKAYIKIGDEIPYQERTFAGGVSSTEVKFKDAAIELEVSPHTVGDEVFLDIVVAKKSPDWSNTIQGNPPLKAQALTTKVSVKSGRTFIVGGLTIEEESVSRSSVPFFSGIPVLGHIFRQENKIKEKKELIIFITPTIIKEEG